MCLSGGLRGSTNFAGFAVQLPVRWVSPNAVAPGEVTAEGDVITRPLNAWHGHMTCQLLEQRQWGHTDNVELRTVHTYPVEAVGVARNDVSRLLMQAVCLNDWGASEAR